MYAGRGGKSSPHPSGLRGREIGMYYRNMNKKKGEKTEKSKKKICIGQAIVVPPLMLKRIKNCIELFDNAPEAVNINLQFEERFQHLLSVDFDKFIAEASESATPGLSADISHVANEELKLIKKAKNKNHHYLECLKVRKNLPAVKQQGDILRAIAKHQVVLIVGSTGCGKTTQVPQLLLDAAIDAGVGASCRIICTQPRRISAVSIAERVAYERGERLGESIGYQIRLESRKPREYGSILFCTTGIILSLLQSDPILSGASVLILDEIHERSVETDLLMALLKKLLPYRPSLKVILMSATVREEDFCAYFQNCPLIRIEGVLYPVEIKYLDDVIKDTGYYKFPMKNVDKKSKHTMMYDIMMAPHLKKHRLTFDRKMIQALTNPNSEGCEDIDFIELVVYNIAAHKPPGAILIFMPGIERITKLHRALENPKSELGQLMKNKLILYPLHSMMPTVDQKSVFQTPGNNMRKVIISTIIAETSLTIDDVVYVINSGRTKISAYDIKLNVQTLQEQWITKANAAQRKGRAGRVQPGVCYNLYTEVRENTFNEIPVPEILSCRLESVILQLKMLHISEPSEFLNTLLSVPSAAAVINGINVLKRIEALDDQGRITPLGVYLARLPVEPQIGKMILMGALLRCIDPITSAAAALSFKSPFYSPLGREREVDQAKSTFAGDMRSDHLMVHYVMHKYRESCKMHREQQFCFANFLSITTLRQLERMKHQFADILQGCQFLPEPNCQAQSSNINSNNMTLLRAVIASGLYPNMAYIRNVSRKGNCVRAIHSMCIEDGQRAVFHPSSVNSAESRFESRYFVYYEKQKSNSLFVMDSTMVYPITLIIFGDNVESGVTPEGVPYIGVGHTHYFKCDPETAEVIKSLREHFKRLLLKKALYPAPIKNDSDEYMLIEALKDILSLDAFDIEDDKEEEEDEDDKLFDGSK